MRQWRCDRGLVNELGRTSEPVVRSLQDELPEGPWRALREYSVVDAQGRILEKCRVQIWSIEEELGITAFAVVGDELRSVTVRRFYSDGFRCERSERLVVGGLREVTAGNP